MVFAATNVLTLLAAVKPICLIAVLALIIALLIIKVKAGQSSRSVTTEIIHEVYAYTFERWLINTP